MRNWIKIFLLFVALSGASSILAQGTPQVVFDYDECGNRVRRWIDFRKVEENGKNVEVENATLATATDLIKTCEISLYPNPTRGKFTVSLSGGETIELQALLTTATGSIVETYLFNEVQHDFDLTNKPAGIYYLRLTAGTDTHVWKIVKQ